MLANSSLSINRIPLALILAFVGKGTEGELAELGLSFRDLESWIIPKIVRNCSVIDCIIVCVQVLSVFRGQKPTTLVILKDSIRWRRVHKTLEGAQFVL